MNAKFEEAFNEWLGQKKYFVIPPAETYEKILNVLLKFADENNVVTSPTERNWVTRLKFHFVFLLEIQFFISRYCLKINNGKAKVFYGDEEVIKQEEVFEKIHEAHIRLGHTGRNIMEHELKQYRGISRLI